MCYWDEDDYFEPSEFDEKIEELKNELKQSVKKKSTMRLRNCVRKTKKLQGIKENFESVKKDYERKKAECDIAIQNAEYKAKHARLKELMEYFKIDLWSVTWSYQYKEKCNKCGKGRKIKVTLPSGRIVDDKCQCGISKIVHYPREERLYRLSDEYRRLSAWYELSSSAEDGDSFTYTTDVKAVIDHNKEFKEIDRKNLRGIFFTTKEECQEFCNYINGTETLGYDYDEEGRMVERR